MKGDDTYTFDNFWSKSWDIDSGVRFSRDVKRIRLKLREHLEPLVKNIKRKEAFRDLNYTLKKKLKTFLMIHLEKERVRIKRGFHVTSCFVIRFVLWVRESNTNRGIKVYNVRHLKREKKKQKSYIKTLQKGKKNVRLAISTRFDSTVRKLCKWATCSFGFRHRCFISGGFAENSLPMVYPHSIPGAKSKIIKM